MVVMGMSDATMKDWLLPMQLRRTYGACEHSITGKMTNGILYSVCNSLSIVFKFLLISLDVFLQAHGAFDRRSLKECKLDDRQALSHSSNTKFKSSVNKRTKARNALDYHLFFRHSFSPSFRWLVSRIRS